LFGSVVPILISLVAVPVYLQRIGSARYGVLAIVWVLLSYFGFFDLGITRAISNHVARLHGAPAHEKSSLLWTALLVTSALGLSGGLLLLLAGHYLLGYVFKIPTDLRPEVLASLPWMALAVPLATTSSVLSGSLEGQERFGVVNIVGVLTNFLLQVVPLSVAILSGPDLSRLIGSMVLVRCAVAVGLFFICRRVIPLKGLPTINRAWIGRLLRYGSWVSISSLISPILTTLDRLIVGAQIGVASLIYYTIPQNLITQMAVLPTSLSRTLFPRFSKLEGVAANEMSQAAFRVLCALITPITVAVLVGLKPFLQIWLGSPVAEVAAPVGEILLIGFWFNSLAFIPFALLQGQGRPDITAKFHMIELLPYLLCLWFGLKIFGIQGAAWAWTLRVTVDAVLLYAVSRTSREHLLSLAPSAGLVILTGFSTAALFSQPAWRIGLGSLLILASAALALKLAARQILSLIASFLPSHWRLRTMLERQ